MYCYKCIVFCIFYFLFLILFLPLFMVKHNSSLLFIPNIIGYIRIFLILISIHQNLFLFICLYSVSVILDFFDGKCARKFNQTSVLGSVLDLVTDRLSTVVLCMRIITVCPSYRTSLSLFTFTDIMSHMLYFIAMCYRKKHHKEGYSLILRLYYNNFVLQTLCFGSETGFIGIYLECCGIKLGWPLEVLKGLIIIKSLVNIAHFQSGISILATV
ncbi:CDP diacylglycerol inositol 3 phosphatidyltransferase [Nucleospora cyclopteri]